MCKPMVADVVQEMIWKIVKETGLTQEELGRFMEAWAAVRGLEAAEADRAFWRDFHAATGEPISLYSMKTPESTPEGVEKVHPDRVEKVHGDGEEILSSDASGASSPEGGAKAGVAQNGPDPAKSAAAAAGMATRKKNALEKLEWLRMAQNRTMADIVDADPKLTLNVLLDFINCKPIPLPQLAAIERAIKKLEAEG